MNLYRFENINITKLFNHRITILRLGDELRNRNKFIFSLKCILLIFYRILINHISINLKSQKKSSKILFVESKLYRNDIKEMLSNLQNCIDEDDYDTIVLKKNRGFSIKRSVYNILMSIVWYIQLSVYYDYNIIERLLIIRLLIDCNDLAILMKNIIRKDKYRICVFFYDAEIYQNFLSQYLQLRGIQTATLQHGIMLAPRPEVKNNIDFAGIEFNSFTSNYFLAWNKFTKSEAIKAGIPESKIKILGIAKCINKTSINTSFSNKKIGIILDGKFEMENNIPLIKIVDSFSRKNGYTYILRYHPNFIGNEYDSFIDSTIGENCNKNISLEDFLQQISFCVVANSTVLFELEYYQVPFLRYKTNNMKDKYRDYPSITFINEKEFEEGVTKLMRYPNYNNSNENIKLNYKLFLESF